MTDPQIFAFLVMPFLLVLTGSMVFFSGDRQKPEEPAKPLEPATKPHAHAPKPRNRRTSSRQAAAGGKQRAWACGAEPHPLASLAMRINDQVLCGLEDTDILSAIEHNAPAIEAAACSRSSLLSFYSLGCIPMHQTDVAAHDVDLILGATLTRAAIRFVASVGALIGISLLLACF